MIGEKEYLLLCLSEEAVEISKDIHKALRFGLEDKVTLDPAGPRGTEGATNLERVIDEMNDLMAVVELLADKEIIPHIWIDEHKRHKKKEKVLAYLEYARRIGQVEPVAGEWISIQDRQPTEADADDFGEVYWRGPNHVRRETPEIICGWESTKNGTAMGFWKRTGVVIPNDFQKL